MVSLGTIGSGASTGPRSFSGNKPPLLHSHSVGSLSSSTRSYPLPAAGFVPISPQQSLSNALLSPPHRHWPSPMTPLSKPSHLVTPLIPHPSSAPASLHKPAASSSLVVVSSNSSDNASASEIVANAQLVNPSSITTATVDSHTVNPRAISDRSRSDSGIDIAGSTGPSPMRSVIVSPSETKASGRSSWFLPPAPAPPPFPPVERMGGGKEVSFSLLSGCLLLIMTILSCYCLCLSIFCLCIFSWR